MKHALTTALGLLLAGTIPAASLAHDGEDNAGESFVLGEIEAEDMFEESQLLTSISTLYEVVLTVLDFEMKVIGRARYGADVRGAEQFAALSVEIKMFRIRSTWSMWDGFGERDRSQTSGDLRSREAHSVSKNEPKRPQFERARAL